MSYEIVGLVISLLLVLGVILTAFISRIEKMIDEDIDCNEGHEITAAEASRITKEVLDRQLVEAIKKLRERIRSQSSSGFRKAIIEINEEWLPKFEEKFSDYSFSYQPFSIDFPHFNLPLFIVEW